MTYRAPLHFFKFLRGRVHDRLKLDRASEEASENEGMAEHIGKASDPIKWERGRLERIGGQYFYVAADASGLGRISPSAFVKMSRQ